MSANSQTHGADSRLPRAFIVGLRPLLIITAPRFSAWGLVGGAGDMGDPNQASPGG